jgi:hypothetical protein
MRAQNAVLAVRSERCFRGARLLELSRALASDGCEFEFAAAVDRGLVVFVLVPRARAVEDAAAEDELEEGLQRRDAGCDDD